VRGRTAVALACLLGARLGAQGTGAVYGTVTDTGGHPLDRARVRAITHAGGTREIAARFTDATGSYRFDSLPAGWLAIDAGLIGYDLVGDSLVLAPGDSVRVDLRLPMRPIIVSPTIVTAAKRSQLLDQAVTSVALVSEQQIAQRAVNTIDEAVDKAPGVQFIAGQVNVRGSSGFAQGLGSRVLLLVDGVPANQGDRGGINWDLVPVDQIARVEVVKGAGSALYGSSAFGGVVNVITKEVSSGWHARLRVTGGAFANPPHAAWAFRDRSGIQDGLDLDGSYGRGSVRAGLSAGARHSDGYRQQDRADHWQVSGKGEWRPEPATLVNLSGAWASDQYDVPEPWCVSGHCADQGQAFQPFLIDTVNRGNRTRSDKGYFTALVTRTPSERTAWTARASWIRTHFTDVYPQRQPPLSTADFAIANRVGLEGRMVSHPDDRRVVTAGLELTRSDVVSNVFSGDTSGGGRTHIEGAYSAYAEAEQTTGQVRTTLGVRGDFLAVDGGGITAFVSPRAGVVWPTTTGAWRGSIGRAYRAPSLAERFVTTYALGFRVIPNPALRAENGWSAEVGRRWTPRPWLRGDAALFLTLARDLIEPVFDASTVAIQFQNVERARLLGLDLSVAVAPLASHLTTTLGYQLLDARELAHDSVPERPLLYRPRHLLTLSADYAVHAFSLGGDFRFSSRFERQDPLFPGDPQLPGKVLDVRASWSAERLAVYLKVANVLNYIYNLAPRVLEPVRTATLTVTLSY
jgi:outer membrane receptor for ferrienterochelin and colicins